MHENNTPSHIIPHDLGVFATKDKLFLFVNVLGYPKNPLHVSVSTNGMHFRGHKSKTLPQIVTKDGTLESTLHHRDYHVSQIGKQYFLLYKSTPNTLSAAVSKDLAQWKKLDDIDSIQESGMVVSNLKHNGKHVMYYGEKDIKVAYSDDLAHWHDKKVVLNPRGNFFDKHALKVESVMMTDVGILLLYSVKEDFREGSSYSIGAALFDAKDPSKLIWRRDKPAYRQHEDDIRKNVYPLGAVHFKKHLIFFFGVHGKSIFGVYFEGFDDLFSTLQTKAKPLLQKHHKNPIIEPILHHSWEHQGTFNPAALHEDGKVHLVYRAMGNNTSFLGYAVSEDGVTITERSKQPIYIPTQEFELPGKYPSVMYMSGGGYGGCEDPRLTKIEEDKRIYLTYIGYNGSDPPRVALSSIEVEDFLQRKWDWKTPILISPPNVVDKNAVLFPEKVQGKYVVMHRIFPNILVDFVDDLEFNNSFLKGEYIIEPKENSWDSRKVGAGAPPIKTPYGWLLIYHAVDDREDSQYKMGAMLLDLKDPTKVLYRTHNPILWPSEHYENHGFKAGVAYPCGAVVKDGMLHVYYGGADQFVCVASTELDQFLSDLINHNQIHPDMSYQHKHVLHHYA